jgi:HAE1 family hydrophobic/amphiphilic exporter-1
VNFTTLFIKRPVMTTLVMIAILVFGIVSYRQLPVSDLPNVDFPTITVSATLPGTSPQTMAATVATPLEKSFSTIAGIDNMTSTSSLGLTQIVIQFALDRNIDAASQDVQASIAQTSRSLPQGIIPPSYQKTNPADAPILTLALTSNEVPLSTLDEFGETTLAQRLSMVSGVAQVQVFGAQKYAVRLQLDPGQLATRGIALEDIVSAVTSQNVNMPTGVLYGERKALTIQATGQLDNASQFSDLIVAYRNGAPVHLNEIGKITDDVQNNKTASWYNGERSIVLAIQRQPGTNTVDVTNRVKDALAKLTTEIPPSIKVSTLFDRSTTIKASVDDVTFTLELTLVLVILVIFLFLRNLSATIIPSLALPMSIIATFSVMYLLGYSLDNLSLMALTLAVGFVVDDAIVMLENIVRHMEMGKPPMKAAVDGAAEVGFTILSMTISLTAVFIPILFLGGIVGRLFHEFAVTIAASILVSGFVSLTLTPMLSSRFLRPHSEETHGRMYQITEAGYDRLLAVYERGLRWVMNHRRLTMLFSFGILAGTVVLFVLVPKGFIPSEDTGQLFVTTETAQGTSYDDMVYHQRQIAAIIQADTNIDNFMSSVGSGGPGGSSNQGRLFISLKPRDKRLKADDIIQELRPKLAKVPGIVVYMQNPPAIQVGGRVSKSLYQFTMQSTDIAELYPAAEKLVDQARNSNLLQDVTSDLQLGNPQGTVQIDRERASSLGITAQQVEEALYDAYGSRQVSTIYTSTNEYWVVMELEPQYQMDLSALSLLYVRSSTGTLVPLSAVSTISQTAGPLSVNHSGQLPSVTLSFNLRPGVALGDAVAEVQGMANKTLPSTISTAFSGTAQAFQSTQAGMLALLGIAVFVIYVVLGVLYESFIHPLTILSGLPFAAFGALLTLLIFKIDLSVYAFVGIILLVGLVKKNAIMMIDFALEAERSEGRSPADAIVHSCLIRFRPIMMTTMAALMGTLPIALSSGAGAEARRPLGVAVVGGLAFSQLITLFVTPVVYTYMDTAREKSARFFNRFGRKGGEHLVPAPAGGAPLEGRVVASSSGDAAD